MAHRIKLLIMLSLIAGSALAQRQRMATIVDFGAVGNNSTNNAAVFNSLNSIAGFDTLTVLVPKGVYRTGTATLNGKVNLQFEHGAQIVLNANANLTISGKLINASNVFSAKGSGARVLMNVDRFQLEWFKFTYGSGLSNVAKYANRRTWEMVNYSMNDSQVGVLELPCSKTLEVDFDIGVQGAWMSVNNNLTIYCPCPTDRFRLQLLQDTIGTIQFAYQLATAKSATFENVEVYTNPHNWRSTTYNVTAGSRTITVGTAIFRDSVFDTGRIIYLNGGSYASQDTALIIDSLYSTTSARLKYAAPATRSGTCYFSTQEGNRTFMLMLGSNVDSVSIKWSAWSNFVTCTTPGCFDANDVGAIMELRRPGSLNDVFLAEVQRVKGDTAFLVSPITNSNGTNTSSFGYNNTQVVYRATKSNFTATGCKFSGGWGEVADSGGNLYNGTIGVYNSQIETFRGGFQMRGGIYASFIMDNCTVSSGLDIYGNGYFDITGVDMNVLHSNGNSSIHLRNSKFFNSRAFGMSQNKSPRSDAVPWYEPTVNIADCGFFGETFYKPLEIVSIGSVYINSVVCKAGIVADARRHLSVTNTSIKMVSPAGTINALDLSSRDSLQGMFVSNVSIEIQNGSHAVNITNGHTGRRDVLENINIVVKTDTTLYVWESPRSTYLLRFNTSSEVLISKLNVKTYKAYDRYRAVLYSQKSNTVLFDQCRFTLADAQIDLGWVNNTGSPACKWLFRDCISSVDRIDIIGTSTGTFNVGAETTVAPTQSGSPGGTVNVTNL